jgi:hypothetical protein
MGFRFRKRLRITEASIIATSPVFNRTFAISPWMVIAIDGSPPSKASPGIRVFLATSAAFRPNAEDALSRLLRIGRGHIGLQLWHEGTAAENSVTMTDLTEAKVIAPARCVRNDYTKSRFSGSVAAAVYSSNRSHWSSH